MSDIANTLDEINKLDVHVAAQIASSMGEANHPLLRRLRFEEKDLVNEILAESIQKKYNFFEDTDPLSLDALKKNGICLINGLLDRTGASLIKQHIDLVGEGVAWHVFSPEKQKVSFPRRSAESEISFDPSELLKCGLLRDVFLNEVVLDIVEGYLGAAPRLFHVNTAYSYPQASTDLVRNGKQYHRDNSHVKMCVLFVYLTSVGEQNGPHCYFKHTHDENQFRAEFEYLNSQDFFDLDEDSYGRDQLFDSNLSDVKMTILGDAGSCFITDPRGVHRGNPLESGERLLAWARYALIPNSSKLNKVRVSPDVFDDLTFRQIYALSSIVDF